MTATQTPSSFQLEPSVRRIVALANRLDQGPDPSVPWSRRRQESAAMSRRGHLLVMLRGPKMHSETNELVDVLGGRILVRIYRPRTGRLPVHLFIHGGGWCIGGLDERDPRCRTIAAEADCVVVSVEYRLAPENMFPTAPEDCYRALEWIGEEAERLDLDANRVSVGGESAGGNLAAVLCLMARDRNGPRIAFQWLDVPAVDLTMSQPSVTSTPPGFMLDYDQMVEFRDAYLPSVATQTEPYASPFHAMDLSGLPPASILTCGADPLRDEGRAYAGRLRDAGVTVFDRHLAGHVHPSFAFTRIATAEEDQRDAIALLRAVLWPVD